MTSPADPDPIDSAVQPAERPVFVVGCAWRCGSTLVQRVLSSNPEIHIWGEGHGMLEDLMRASGRLATKSVDIEWVLTEFREKGLKGFIANLNPPVPRAGGLAARAWLEAFYLEPTRELGKSRWGAKEVCWDASHARFLLEAFPHARIIFLIRSPISVLASMRSAAWYASAGGPSGVAARWTRQTESFLDCDDPRALTLRYEDLIADPATSMARVAEQLGVPSDSFDLTLFTVPVRGMIARPSVELLEVRELMRPELRRVALRAGYPDPAADPRGAILPALSASVARVLGVVRSPKRVQRAIRRRLVQHFAGLGNRLVHKHQ